MRLLGVRAGDDVIPYPLNPRRKAASPQKPVSPEAVALTQPENENETASP